MKQAALQRRLSRYYCPEGTNLRKLQTHSMDSEAQPTCFEFRSDDEVPASSVSLVANTCTRNLVLQAEQVR